MSDDRERVLVALAAYCATLADPAEVSATFALAARIERNYGPDMLPLKAFDFMGLDGVLDGECL